MKPEYARLLRAADAVVALVNSGDLFDIDSEPSVERASAALDDLEGAVDQCRKAAGAVSPFVRHAALILDEDIGNGDELRRFVRNLADFRSPSNLGWLLQEASDNADIKRAVVECFLQAALNPGDPALRSLAVAITSKETLCA